MVYLCFRQLSATDVTEKTFFERLYRQSHLGWHFRILFQSSKLTARTFLWNVAKETFELWAFNLRKWHPKWDWLYLVLGLRKIALCVSCPCAPTTLTVHSTIISRFLRNPSSMIHQVIWYRPPGTLLMVPSSWYPRAEASKVSPPPGTFLPGGYRDSARILGESCTKKIEGPSGEKKCSEIEK